MKRVFTIAFLLLTTRLHASDTTRVLYVGNSFIYTYDVPALVKGMADAAGQPLEYLQHTPPGATVGDVAQDTYAHMKNPTMYSLVRQGIWDYVVLQDNQGRFINFYGIFPDTNNYKVVRGHLQIQDSIHYYNSCARMLLFAGWAFKAGYPPYGNTGADLNNNIYANYKYLNDTMHEVISPIGKAWNRANLEVPGTDLWGPDAAHQSLAGSYLTAAVIFCGIYRADITNLSYNGGLDSATARIYRKIAYETVRDSVQPTNLISDMPGLSISGNMLIATAGYTTYDWYTDGNFTTSGTANTYSITANPACYQVIATDSNGCRHRSFRICNGVTEKIPSTLFSGLNTYPNPVTGNLSVDLQEYGIAEMELTDMAGRRIISKELHQGHNEWNMTELPNGIYFLTVSVPKGIYRQKIIKQ